MEDPSETKTAEARVFALLPPVAPSEEKGKNGDAKDEHRSSKILVPESPLSSPLPVQTPPASPTRIPASTANSLLDDGADGLLLDLLEDVEVPCSDA